MVQFPYKNDIKFILHSKTDISYPYLHHSLFPHHFNIIIQSFIIFDLKIVIKEVEYF